MVGILTTSSFEVDHEGLAFFEDVVGETNKTSSECVAVFFAFFGDCPQKGILEQGVTSDENLLVRAAVLYFPNDGTERRSSPGFQMLGQWVAEVLADRHIAELIPHHHEWIIRIIKAREFGDRPNRETASVGCDSHCFHRSFERGGEDHGDAQIPDCESEGVCLSDSEIVELALGVGFTIGCDGFAVPSQDDG